MQKISWYGTAVDIAHAIAVICHGLAHQKIPVPISIFQALFVGFVSVLAPVIAIAFLWTQFRRAGLLLLLSSMAGSLICLLNTFEPFYLLLQLLNESLLLHDNPNQFLYWQLL